MTTDDWLSVSNTHRHSDVCWFSSLLLCSRLCCVLFSSALICFFSVSCLYLFLCSVFFSLFLYCSLLLPSVLFSYAPLLLPFTLLSSLSSHVFPHVLLCSLVFLSALFHFVLVRFFLFSAVLFCSIFSFIVLSSPLSTLPFGFVLVLSPLFRCSSCYPLFPFDFYNSLLFVAAIS